ncbi:hypothetical protein M758_11G078100 [Ceratodon purpureus]|uniref:Uncharacterized protein n=1 Tax=Ceratodon purpureus TaxID=3225 RepID=A0A8T0GG94_CERPU|nr:hypothetical protein KC19_11G080700 [Ceratodon purpureus]KAG0601024.1 hypothetical protein M758_11G078100 [Ceratodon purpureus]
MEAMEECLMKSLAWMETAWRFSYGVDFSCVVHIAENEIFMMRKLLFVHADRVIVSERDELGGINNSTVRKFLGIDCGCDGNRLLLSRLPFLCPRAS